MPPARSRADADPKDLTSTSSRHTNTIGASSGATKRSRQNNANGAPHTAGASRDRDRERGGQIGGAANIDGAVIDGVNSIGGITANSAAGIDWPSAPPHLLHAYRHAYNLPLPSAFRSPLSSAVLTSPAGIGRHSPTMIGRRRPGAAARSSPLIANGNSNVNGNGNGNGSSNANGVGSADSLALPGEQTASTSTARRARGPVARPAKTSKEALALAVRRHFNSLAVSEADVVVEFLYRVKFGKRSLRWRFGGGVSGGGVGVGNGRALG